MNNKFKLAKIFNLNDIPQDIVNDLSKLNNVLYEIINKEIIHFKVSEDNRVLSSLNKWLVEHGALDGEIVYINPYKGM